MKAIKSYKNIHKRNIHNKLFNDFKKRKKHINELEKKIYQIEEKICTFSPKINSNSIKYKNFFLERVNKIKNQESLYDIINNFSSSNINRNEYCKNSFNTSSFKVLNQFRNTNPKFYPRTANNRQNGNISKNIIGRNNRDFQKLDNFHTNKEIMPINYIILNDINHINKPNKYNVVLNDIKDNEINNDFYNLEEKNLIGKRNIRSNKNLIIKEGYNNNGINKKLNNIKIENNNKENVFTKYFNFIELNNKRKDKLRNKTFNQNNKYEIKKEKSSQNFDINKNVYNKLLKNNKSKELLIKSDKGINKSNIEQEGLEFFSNKFFPKKNNNIFHKNENVHEKQKINANNKIKKRNFLKKSNSICSEYINPIDLFNTNENNETKRLDNEFNYNKQIFLYKKNKSLSSMNINKNKSYSFSNNSISKNPNFINSIKETNGINLINKKENNNLAKKNYFYTFRNKKGPYNFFNYFSNINSKTNTSKKKLSAKSNNDLINNNKIIIIKKDNTGISHIKKQDNQIDISKLYQLHNNMNNIYSNNYKNNVKDSNENIIKNKIINKNAYSIGKMRPSINTINTNNDTKGYSSSTLSAKDIQFLKTNSKRGSKCSFNQNISEYKNNTKQIGNDFKNISKIIKRNELKYNSKSENNNYENLEINSKVENICLKEKEKRVDIEDSIKKIDKSMTLQSISDSKMLELAEHYIDTKDDCLEDIGIKKVLFKKPIRSKI